MSASSPRPPVRRAGLAGFAALNAVAAWAGAVGLAAGGIDFGDHTNDRLPFDSLVLAGIALAVIVAVAPHGARLVGVDRGGPNR